MVFCLLGCRNVLPPYIIFPDVKQCEFTEKRKREDGVGKGRRRRKMGLGGGEGEGKRGRKGGLEEEKEGKAEKK